MKTLSAFIESSHLPARLIRSTVRQCGDWRAFTEMAQDVCEHGADCGFSGFTYCGETVPFAKRNKAAILETAANLAKDVGDGDIYQFIAGFVCLKNMESTVLKAISTSSRT